MNVRGSARVVPTAQPSITTRERPCCRSRGSLLPSDRTRRSWRTTIGDGMRADGDLPAQEERLDEAPRQFSDRPRDRLQDERAGRLGHDLQSIAPTGQDRKLPAVQPVRQPTQAHQPLISTTHSASPPPPVTRAPRTRQVVCPRVLALPEPYNALTCTNVSVRVLMCPSTAETGCLVPVVL